MTYQRLWLEDSRERSLDNLADLLEGYYRCRNPGAQRPAGGDKSYTGCSSPLDYLGYFNKLSFAYATLPLRLLSQLYGRCPVPAGCASSECAAASPACGPVAPSGTGRASTEREALIVEPACIALGRGGKRKAFSHFTVRSNIGGAVSVSFDGFKDASGNPVNDIELSVRDDISNWTVISNPKIQLDMNLDDCDCRIITVKVAPKAAKAKAVKARPNTEVCLSGKLKVTTESKLFAHVKIVLTIQEP